MWLRLNKRKHLDHPHQRFMGGSWVRDLRPDQLKENIKWVYIAEPGLSYEPVRGEFKPRVTHRLAGSFRVDLVERRDFAFLSSLKKARVSHPCGDLRCDGEFRRFCPSNRRRSLFSTL